MRRAKVGRTGYVFTRPNGTPIEGTRTRHFTALLHRARLRRTRFHLRHSAATLLLEQGVELVVIKELLGHAHIGVYAHARLRLQRRAIDTLGYALGRPTMPPRTHPALAENIIRPGGRWCARCTGGRPAGSPERVLSRGWRSRQQDDRPCCCDWLTGA
ncbi:tyrosine-type recombinase/integrase [Streptomyces antimycoticus]|uniref:tyrosine-type recombinase/integrase n=1 Tax=Streptomyces antimycoticus TaxID=68175 RepID=UPI003F4D1829